MNHTVAFKGSQPSGKIITITAVGTHRRASFFIGCHKNGGLIAHFHLEGETRVDLLTGSLIPLIPVNWTHLEQHFLTLCR